MTTMVVMTTLMMMLTILFYDNDKIVEDEMKERKEEKGLQEEEADQFVNGIGGVLRDAGDGEREMGIIVDFTENNDDVLVAGQSLSVQEQIKGFT